jgi:hypothetical protein
VANLGSSVADPGCLSRIPDPNVSIPDPGFRVKKIPDPRSASVSRILSIINPIKCFKAVGKIIWDVHPGFFFNSGYPIGINKKDRIPDPDPQHW